MILRTDPFRDFRDPFGLLSTTAQATPMPVDVYRRDDAYLVQINLPGVVADSIDVTVRRNVITISAQPARPDESSLELLLNERPVGTMTRSIALGEEIDATNVQADYVNGVLLLHLPVAEAARPRRINIRHGDSKAVSAH
ncbi:MAG: Hsp20/alpha crystallin family protein [Acidobacteria bacterium]|nr:Hsp20/alpha crystallin family protein [Acidobacteriota bacterium]